LTTICLTAAATSGMMWPMGRGSDHDAGPGRDEEPGPGSGEHGAWDHLARLIRERRAELGLTQREVHSVGGPSPATLYQLESGHRGSYRPHILRRLERALGWGAGSVRRALAGGLPLLEGETENPPPRPVQTAPGDSGEWIDGFRNLPIDTREKLLILSSLLEETIADLGPSVGPPRRSR
jgi:transcriptional regulator with XRE-family HTH domain